jgi:hypothetical protein
MKEKSSLRSKALLTMAVFFEETLSVLRPSVVKLLVVLVVAVLLAFYFVRKNIDPALGLGLVIVVALLFACLAAALQYAGMRFRYAQRTEEQLKSALRETVLELQEKKMGRLPSPDVKITYIEYDPPGDDLENEFARVENTGEATTDLTNWTLCDEANHQFTFPAFILRPGKYIRVWTKAGTNTATDLYWGRGQAVWNKAGDCAYLRDSTGTLIDTYRWSPRY